MGTETKVRMLERGVYVRDSQIRQSVAKKGKLYFGIKNDGAIVGQTVSEKTLRDISQAIGSHIEPKIFPEITKETFNNLDYIKVRFKGTEKPYFAYGRVYLRVADEDKQLTSREIEKMILEKNIYHSKWDSELSPHLLSEADSDAIAAFVLQLEKSGRIHVQNNNVEDILKKLGLIRGNKLSYAAWHLFCNSQPAELQLAVFKGRDKSGFIDIKPLVKGNLFLLLETSIEFLMDKINWRVEFGKDMKRHEINEIAFFSDRIEIFNPGAFPYGLTPDDFIRGHERSHLRNPQIAEVFYYTKNIDRWGSGLQRIDNKCSENNIDYSFKVLSNGVLVTFYRPRLDKDSGMRVIESSVKIIDLIRKNKNITIVEIANELEMTTRAIEKQIARLKKEGLLKRIGPAKGGHWEVIRGNHSNDAKYFNDT